MKRHRVAPAAAIAGLALVIPAAPAVATAGPEAPAVPGRSATVRDIDTDALQQLLDEWRLDVEGFGASGVEAYGATLSLRVPGHDEIHLASGVDGRDPETPMPTDGTFRIDRVSTTFVAALVFQLVDEGRLSLDDTVERWLPEIPRASEITVAMLLDQTSGIGSWRDAADYGSTLIEDLDRAFTPEEVLVYNLDAPVPTPIAGEGWEWSEHGNYVALGLLIEHELGEDLATVLAQRITGPLALDDTVLSSDYSEVTLHGWFALDGNPDRPLDALSFPGTAVASSVWASGAMVSTSADLLDWADALYSGDVLSAESTAAMLEMRNVWANFPAVQYGLGASGYCLDGPDCDLNDIGLVGHRGNYTGSATRIAHHPDSGITFVLHANVTPVDTDKFISLVNDVLRVLGVTSGRGPPPSR